MGISGIKFVLLKTKYKFNMLNLVGVYECKVDSKGRLGIPSALKKQLSEVLVDGFVLKRSVFRSCLELYPNSEWKTVMGKVNQLNRFVKKNNDFIRKFTAGVKPIEIDTNGRVLIPKDLTAFASIKKEVVVCSAINIIEIWDKEKYEQTLIESEDSFADLAEEVMGSLENE